jgi:UDP-glucuronate decarboxylase
MDTAEGFTGPINLGNPKEFTIRELANQIAELTGAKMNIKSMPMPADDPKQRQPDISLAQKELEWSPAIELKDGLVMTIEYFKKLIQEG